jgi:hypothetical protein
MEMNLEEMEWQHDSKGQYVWSATNGKKCYLLDYAKELKSENDVLKITLEHYKSGGNIKF